MTQEELNEFLKQWLNGKGLGKVWEKIKAGFVGGLWDQSQIITPASAFTAFQTQARANIGLSRSTLISDLWAGRAQSDEDGNIIKQTYAHGLDINGGYLRLLDNRANPEYLARVSLNTASGLLQLDASAKIPLVHIPDDVLGQLTYGGNIVAYGTVSNVEYVRVEMTTSARRILEVREHMASGTLNNVEIRLVAVADKPADQPEDDIYYFNYADCAGMYFIWTQSALINHTSEDPNPGYWRVWPENTGKIYESGDWMTTDETKWDKVDNTDAVTGVKGARESVYRLGNVNLTPADLGALDLFMPNTTQSVQGNVEFLRNAWAQGGMAAYGMSDLSTGGGGSGGGISGSIIRDWADYVSTDDSQILGANLGIKSFQMSGRSFQVGYPDDNNGISWQTVFTLDENNIPNIGLTKVTGTDDLRAIESLTGTGVLQRTGNNTWALLDAAGLRSYAGITGDIYNHNASEFVTAVSISGTNLLVTKAGETTTTAINAATLQGHASDYFATQEALTSAVSTLSGGISQVLAMAQDNAANITLHDDRISDLESYFDGSSANHALLASKATQLETTRKIFGIDFNGTQDVSGNMTGVTSIASLLYFDVTNNRVGIGVSTPTEKLDVNGNVKAVQLKSTAASGTAPLVVTSETLVEHLNADLLDGKHWTDFVNTIGVNGKKVTYTKGTTTSEITVPFASLAEKMDTETMQETQEFIYRQSPKTIDADSMRIDRILGRTLVWNQMTKDSIDYSSYFTGSKSGNRYNLVTKTIAAYESIIISTKEAIVGHKYYIGIDVYVNELSQDQRINSNSTNFTSAALTIQHGSTGYKSAIVSKVYDDISDLWRISNGSSSQASGAAFEFRSPIIIDLTLFFNGNIPEGLTAATFERDYGYLLANSEYNAQQFINNSAEGLESEGFNLFDGTFSEYGKYLDANGAAVDNSNYIISNYIRVLPNTDYFCHKLMSAQVSSPSLCFYDADYQLISSLSGGDLLSEKIIHTPSNAMFVKTSIVYANVYNSATINLSDTNRNGQYEPYKKNVLPLNLNSFRVKDAQGNIVTINGLKKAGPVYDEIVRNRYIKRVGSVDLGTLTWDRNATYGFHATISDIKQGTDNVVSNIMSTKYLPANWNTFYSAGTSSGLMAVSGRSVGCSSTLTTSTAFKTSVQGVWLNYELATPIEYEIIDPIPNVMPSGTTERVVSDEMIAPFCADITYGTNNGDILASSTPWDKIFGKPTTLAGYGIEDASLEVDKATVTETDDTVLVSTTLGDQQVFVKLTVNEGAFKLTIASDDTAQPAISRTVEFATLSDSDIDEICV